MRRVVRHLGLAVVLLGAACNETSVVLAIHSSLRIPADLDAICLQVVAGEAWEFGRRYPLAEEDAGVARTLSVLAGDRHADRFELLLRGERRGWPVSFERALLEFREHEVVTEHLYLPACTGKRVKAGTGVFPSSTANGTLANGATAVAAVPVAFAPSQMMTVSGAPPATEARRFAWRLNDSGKKQVMLHEQGMPKIDEEVSRLLGIDIDNDCDLDLVVLARSGPRVWRQLDGGVFEELPNAIFLSEAFAAGAVADFNRDGYQDLFLVSATAVRLLLNDAGSPGRFVDSPTSVQAVSGGGVAVAVGLLDSDGNPDLVLVRGGASSSLVLASNPGTATSPVSLTVSAIGLSDQDTTAVAVADLDGDGVQDLAFGSSTGPSTLLLNSKASPGTFAAPVPIPNTASSDVRELHVVDLDNDCRRDLVLGTSESVRILLNTGNAVFSEKSSLEPPPPKPTAQILSVDLDGDSLLDLVMLGGGAATYHLQQAPGS
jgi:hypothetical protein